MKAKYETPTVKIDVIILEDIITTSEVGPKSTINGQQAQGLEDQFFSIYR